MRVSCQKAFILVVASTMACHETTAPPFVGSFTLESINSQPVPANIQAEGGDTITVISSFLTLDAAGKAQISEHIRYVHPNSPPGEVTYTTSYSYRITGSNIIEGRNIVFDYSPPCPPNALCAAPPTGTLMGSTLVISWGPPQAKPPFVYRQGILFD